MIVLLAFGVALLSVLLGAVCWTLYGLLRQNGRLLARLEAVEATLTKSSDSERVFADRSLVRSRINRAGLAPGTIAPEFRLPTLEGGQAALSDYAGRGLLLVFSDPECAPCLALLPRLQRAAGASGIAVLVISRGTAEANRRKMQAAGVTLPVALQAHWEISRLYAQFSTPVGYLVDRHGRIAENVALGAGPILALLSNANQQRREPEDDGGAPRPLVH
jgi:peroxiredoxin